MRLTPAAEALGAEHVPGLRRAAGLFRTVPDFPAPGVVFQDMGPLLADADALRAGVRGMLAPFEGRFDVVAGLDARGFLLAGYAAALAGVGMVPLRKAGKLPAPVGEVTYDLEYGQASIEAAAELAVPGLRVLVVDDVLATGGTLAAAHELVRQAGAATVGAAVLLEIPALGGRRRTPDVHALFTA
ncbi:adenine phosphoribosyltransferase [Micrococcus sp.]|uniref:adenine phosphoribosyltransferase n=1 Tax=Micrococcus sp. TaxID=1271 RepID=UPI0039C717A2